VHDLGRLPDGRSFYVMKLVQGQRLDAHARREPLLSSRLRLFEKICEAVSFAHAQGVIHRDLKPENIMVGSFGEVLVMDWGTAKVLSAPEPGPAPGPLAQLRAGREAGTAHGTVLGTPGYMAPEQERGEVDRIDERTDVHALGAILRFLLDVEDTPAPPPLRAIAAKAQAPDPALRYGGVRELARDVSDHLSGLPIRAYREGPLERLVRLARKHRTPLLVILAYLVMRAILLFGLGV
jgi:eukaryotic-like serine/threonine-protein kinase